MIHQCQIFPAKLDIYAGDSRAAAQESGRIYFGVVYDLGPMGLSIITTSICKAEKTAPTGGQGLLRGAPYRQAETDIGPTTLTQSW